MLKSTALGYVPHRHWTMPIAMKKYSSFHTWSNSTILVYSDKKILSLLVKFDHAVFTAVEFDQFIDMAFYFTIPIAFTASITLLYTS
jgi:hypothetical protein